MAADDRTEKPTPKRKAEARKKGQVAKSRDLDGALVLAAGLVAVSSFGPAIVRGAAGAMRAIFAMIARSGQSTSAAGLHQLVGLIEQTLLATVAPIAGICLAVGVLTNVAQVGIRPTFHVLRPNFGRINPAGGVKRIFGANAPIETLKSLAKVAIVGAVAATALVPKLTHGGAAVGTPPAALGLLLSSSLLGIGERVAAAYVLLGLIDFIWQKRRLAKSMKMTKQEVKDEAKQRELSGEIKGAIRRRQIQAARQRMMSAVPQADVVVTNPTHFAVALSYDGQQPAPVVVAKGQDLVAMQIRRIAQDHDVPIVPDAPLARSLHGSVEIGQMIPAELYAAVAQVLAFVYRMAGRRKATA